MNIERFQAVLWHLAKENGTTPSEIYRSMQEAIDDAQANPDPVIQDRWRQIPHKGSFVTVEELFEYFAQLDDWG